GDFLAGGAALQLDDAVGEALGADGQLPWHADQVGGGELAAGTLVGVVVEHVLAGGLESGDGVLAGGGDGGVVGAQVDDHDVEGGDGVGPDDAALVVAGLDDGAEQARHADAVGAHVHRGVLAVGALHVGLHRDRVFGPEVEDVAHLDAAGRQTVGLGGLVFEAAGVVHFLGGGVESGSLIND